MRPTNDTAPITAVRFLLPSPARYCARSEGGGEGEGVEQRCEDYSYMFASTPTSIVVYYIPSKGEPQITYRDDMTAVGSPLLASRLPQPHQLAIQQGEGIFCLDANEGNLWALPSLEGEEFCKILTSYRHYLVAISSRHSQRHSSSSYGGSIVSATDLSLGDRGRRGIEEDSSSSSKKTSSLGVLSSDGSSSLALHSHATPRAGEGGAGELPPQEFLTIYYATAEVRFVAFSAPILDVLHVVPAMESLYVICRGSPGRGQGGYPPHAKNLLIELREKSFDDRLNILLRKRLFDWAEEIVLKDRQPNSTLQEVYRLHADWLYEKRMFDKALRMYIKTIGTLEPSYVIEKYIHCQRLWLLAVYLLHLHRRGVASQQHTLLFFKCAAQLKDDLLFSAFLDDPNISREAVLPAAIKECRATGYTKLAAAIAYRHGYHEEYVSLLLSEYKNYEEAVRYLKKLEAPSACSLLLLHGYELLTNKPKDSLHLLKNIILKYHTSVDVFLPLFVDNEALLFYFISSLLFGKKETVLFIERQCQGYRLLSRQGSLSLSQGKGDAGSPVGTHAYLGDRKEEEEECPRSSTCGRDSLSQLLRDLDLAVDLSSSSSSSSRKSVNGHRRIQDEEQDDNEEEEEEEEEEEDLSPTLPSHVFGSGAIATFLEILLRFYRRALLSSSSASRLGYRRPQYCVEDKNRGDRSKLSEYKTNGGLEGKKPDSLASLLPSSSTPRCSQGQDSVEREKNVLNERTRLACEKKQEKDEEKGERRIGEIASGYGSMIMRTLRERTVGEDELFTGTLLSTLYGFEEGLLYTCEKRGDYLLPLSHLSEKEDLLPLLQFCLSNTSKEPSLWVYALSFLASREGTDHEIQQILAHIETRRLLHPLAVLDILQRGSKVTLKAVKGYLLHSFEKLDRELKMSLEHFNQDEVEVGSMRAEIHRLRTSGQVFDNSRCDDCGGYLDLPSVFFACSHAFHLYCLTQRNNEDAHNGDRSDRNSPGGFSSSSFSRGGGALHQDPAGHSGMYSCPLCAPQFEAKRLLLAQREAESKNKDDFFKFLRGAQDGCSFIASYFGKGMFPPPD
ncbi:vacuolar protein sorting 11 carboxy-terminal protein, partial [Cystoisospora suis]